MLQFYIPEVDSVEQVVDEAESVSKIAFENTKAAVAAKDHLPSSTEESKRQH